MYRSITVDDQRQELVDKAELAELRRKAAKWDDLARVISNIRDENES
jgi:hypothetical protein